MNLKTEPCFLNLEPKLRPLVLRYLRALAKNLEQTNPLYRVPGLCEIIGPVQAQFSKTYKGWVQDIPLYEAYLATLRLLFYRRGLQGYWWPFGEREPRIIALYLTAEIWDDALK